MLSSHFSRASNLCCSKRPPLQQLLTAHPNDQPSPPLAAARHTGRTMPSQSPNHKPELSKVARINAACSLSLHSDSAPELRHPSHRLQVPDHQTLQRVPPHVQSVHRRNALVQLPRICSPGHPQSLLMFLHSPHAPPHMPTKQLESVAPTTASLQLILEALAIRAPCADAHPLMLAWHRRHTKIAVKKSVPEQRQSKSSCT